MAPCLSTGLNPTCVLNKAKHGYYNIEGFLTTVGKISLKEDFRRRQFERPKNKTREIYEVIQKLKKYRSVSVLIDKTNPTRVIEIKDYKQCVSDHMLKAANLALHLKVIALFEDAKKLLKKVKWICQFKMKIL